MLELSNIPHEIDWEQNMILTYSSVLCASFYKLVHAICIHLIRLMNALLGEIED